MWPNTAVFPQKEKLEMDLGAHEGVFQADKGMATAEE